MTASQAQAKQSAATGDSRRPDGIRWLARGWEITALPLPRGAGRGGTRQGQGGDFAWGGAVSGGELVAVGRFAFRGRRKRGEERERNAPRMMGKGEETREPKTPLLLALYSSLGF